MGVDSKTVTLMLGETALEMCRLITPGGRWYTLRFERLLGEGHHALFPTYLVEDQEGLLIANYADGSRETFVGLEDLNFHFTARITSYETYEEPIEQN